jgi:aspartyl-tRNA(Asn)/glutamyl-tRNA(Gln) amidotransferase subunit A
MAGHDPRDPTTLRETPPDFVAAVDQDIKGLRIGWSSDYGFAAVDSEVAEVTYKAAQVFSELGCHVEDADLVLDQPYEAYGPLYELAAYASYGQYVESYGDQMTNFAKDFIRWGSKVTATDLARSLGLIDRLKAQFANLFEKYDLLLSPTLAVPSVAVGSFPDEIAGKPVYPHRYFSFHPFTYPINAIGHAAASVPAGFSSDGMPIGLHIVGRRGGEETVIAASGAFEKARPWAQHRPSVS